jgi:protein-S-isoprenylcysteine O-methyltransferase Ste14
MSPLAALRGFVLALLVLALDAVLLSLGLGSVRAMLRDPRALALLAVWGAGGIVLAWSRPTRGHDAERARPDPRSMLVLFVVPLVSPALGAFAARQGWLVLPWTPLHWIAISLVAAGLAIRVAAMLQLRHRFSPVMAVQREHELETRGPYAWVRHPGYLGALLACLGGALAFGSVAALPLVALMLRVQLTRVRREERLLADHFGAEWSAYAARTGALLPLLGRARLPAAAGDA